MDWTLEQYRKYNDDYGRIPQSEVRFGDYRDRHALDTFYGSSIVLLTPDAVSLDSDGNPYIANRISTYASPLERQVIGSIRKPYPVKVKSKFTKNVSSHMSGAKRAISLNTPILSCEIDFKNVSLVESEVLQKAQSSTDLWVMTSGIFTDELIQSQANGELNTLPFPYNFELEDNVKLPFITKTAISEPTAIGPSGFGQGITTPTAMAVHRGDIYVATRDGGITRMYRVDKVTGIATQVGEDGLGFGQNRFGRDVNPTITGMVSYDDKLYVLLRLFGSRISVLDENFMQVPVGDQSFLGLGTTGARPNSLAVIGDKFYTLSELSDVILSIDPSIGQGFVTTIENLAGRDATLTSYQGLLIITSKDGRQVFDYNFETGIFSEIGSISVGVNEFTGSDYDPIDDKMYILNGGDSSLHSVTISIGPALLKREDAIWINREYSLMRTRDFMVKWEAKGSVTNPYASGTAKFTTEWHRTRRIQP